ncbi:sugar ABC transporter substrate-binding protein [Pseudooceanicola sp.]|uniref:sugar ABC transporter substrate-binding protein n=1 Tax=Pseudooceanicola sp. TaxID=1914328 RepID=UPI0035132B0D
MKTLLCKPAALALACAFAANTASAENAKTIALLVGPTQDAFIGTWVATFEAGAKAQGMDVSVFSSPFDPALQARQFDDAVAQNFDGIILQAISQNAIVPSLTRAKEADVPVLTAMAPLAEDSKTLAYSYIGEDSTTLGTLAARAMAEALAAQGKSSGRIAAITGALAEGVAPLRLDAFKKTLAELAPDFEIVAIEDVKWNPVTGEQVTGQLLARFAGTGGLDGIYGMNDRLANAAVQAAETAGIALGGDDGLIIVGGNCQAPGIQGIMAGTIAATVEMLPAVSASTAVQVMQELLNGGEVAPEYFEQHVIVTADNLADHASACSY